MKICILTQPLGRNYGGLLQAFALQTVLKRLGHEVVTDRNGARKLVGFSRFNPFNYLFTPKRKQVATNTEPFIRAHIDTIDFFGGKQQPEEAMLARFDALVVGSDQVWRPAYNYIPAYFLDFSKGKPVKRIAYAASFGVDYWEYSAGLTRQCVTLASRFDAISVREDSGVTLCHRYLGVEAIPLIDPTLLLEQEDYLAIVEKKGEKVIEEMKMMCYLLDPSPDKRMVVDRISSALGFSPLVVGMSEAVSPTVPEWIDGFRSAEYVVTDSFHGMVFALIFNKPFVAILNTGRGSSRFTSLLRIFHLEDRMIGSLDELTDAHLQPVDYTRVNQIRKEWQAKSFDFLQRNLT